MKKITILLLILNFNFGCNDPKVNETLSSSLTKGRIKTIYGDIVFKFFPNEAPLTCERVKQLIKKDFYNGLPFHRVIPGYIIQTGKPKNSPEEIGSGKSLKFEKNELRHQRGSLAMARHQNNINSAGSQFYISLSQNEKLDGKYTIFAKVTEGIELLKKIKLNDKVILITLE